jgi:hypothetical protein
MKTSFEYTCWCEMPDRTVRRISVEAASQHAAITAARLRLPTARAVSARLADRDEPPTDALAVLDRRAKGQP